MEIKPVAIGAARQNDSGLTGMAWHGQFVTCAHGRQEGVLRSPLLVTAHTALVPSGELRGLPLWDTLGEMAFSVCLLFYCPHCEGKMFIYARAVLINISDELKEENTD